MAHIPAILRLHVNDDADDVAKEVLFVVHPDRRRFENERVIATLPRREIQTKADDLFAVVGGQFDFIELGAQIGFLAVRREDPCPLGPLRIEHLVFEGVAELVGERDRFVGLYGLLARDEHVVMSVGRRRESNEKEQGERSHVLTPFGHHTNWKFVVPCWDAVRPFWDAETLSASRVELVVSHSFISSRRHP